MIAIFRNLISHIEISVKFGSQKLARTHYQCRVCHNYSLWDDFFLTLALKTGDMWHGDFGVVVVFYSKSHNYNCSVKGLQALILPKSTVHEVLVSTPRDYRGYYFFFVFRVDRSLPSRLSKDDSGPHLCNLQFLLESLDSILLYFIVFVKHLCAWYYVFSFHSINPLCVLWMHIFLSDAMCCTLSMPF